MFDVLSDYLGRAIWREQIGLIMMGLVAADIFLVFNFKRENRRQLQQSVSYIDIVLAVIALVLFGYAAWNYEGLSHTVILTMPRVW